MYFAQLLLLLNLWLEQQHFKCGDENAYPNVIISVFFPLDRVTIDEKRKLRRKTFGITQKALHLNRIYKHSAE